MGRATAPAAPAACVVSFEGILQYGAWLSQGQATTLAKQSQAARLLLGGCLRSLCGFLLLGRIAGSFV